ncbi:glycosyltransferase family 4 protein [Rhodospirillum sp. A1_3_36]|uniref:glycosyltransferase family 4 protein n=1 Tax=Rhodospirillum sp. A1_3_36 TaxID=3391666 RepID=UPI0039A5E0C8
MMRPQDGSAPTSRIASNSSVKVAVIATHVPPATGFGGIAECVGRQAKIWSERGHSFSLTLSDGSMGAPLTRENVDLPASVPLRIYRTPRQSHWAKRWGFGLGAIPAIWSSCSRAKIVHIHGLGSWPTLVAQAICWMTGRPMVVTLHAGIMATHITLLQNRKPFKWRLYRFFVLPALRRAVMLQATTELEAESSAPVVPGIPMQIIPNGVDLTSWFALPWPEPPPPESGRTLCYMGRFSPEKGPLSFLRLWRVCRREGDRLILVGDGKGPYAEAVETLAKAIAAELPDTLELLPYQDFAGMRAVLSRAHGLVLPSGIEGGDMRENFGNVVAEAMASGRPVVVARGLAWDSVERDGAGLVFDPTETSLADTLDRFRRMDAEALATMGHRGRALAEAHYDMESVAEALWEMMEQALSPRLSTAPPTSGP